jgi:serine/threonine protein phosphatase PrpC
MALIPPFKCTELATSAGAPSSPNEDYAVAGPDWAIALDGATHSDGVDTGCVHDVSWLVGHLAAALMAQLTLSRMSLVEVLAAAIEATCAAHADTCDLTNPDSPSSTVAMVRASETSLEYLVLGDSAVIVKTQDHVTAVTDDRADYLQPGGRPYTRALVRSKRNAPGGFWVASTNTRAAYEARSESASGATHVALLTDGVTRLVAHYGYDWPEIFSMLDRDGPAALIDRVHDAERKSPPPIHRYGKQQDDATAIYIRLT